MAHSWTRPDPRSRPPAHSPTDSAEPRLLAAELVLRELLETDRPLSETELAEATLPPTPTVEGVLSELDAVDAFDSREEDNGRRYRVTKSNRFR